MVKFASTKQKEKIEMKKGKIERKKQKKEQRGSPLKKRTEDNKLFIVFVIEIAIETITEQTKPRKLSVRFCSFCCETEFLSNFFVERCIHSN